jgi:hypothetical protein
VIGSHIILEGCFGDIVLSLHTSTEDKSDDGVDCLCEKLERIFDQFSK